MYALGDSLPDEEVPPGTNLLMTGPAMSGKRRLGLEILSVGSNRGEGAIIVSTTDGAERFVEEFGALVSEFDDVPIGIIDCVTKQQGRSPNADDDRISYISSPVDMTGIGISLSEYLETFHQERMIRDNRVLFHSISTLLMYTDLKTVFRFLHVFTGRIQTADALGVYVIDSQSHDAQTMNTLKQLFDGMIDVPEDGQPNLTLA